MKRFPLVLLAFVPAFAFADVTVEKVKYRDWTDCYRLSNGTVEVVVVPKIGRVMRYAYIGKENVLWENPSTKPKPDAVGYRNYGGDKVWPAPQRDWNWPPDPAIDGSAWQAELIPNGVRITSPTSKFRKIRFVREITLAAFGTEARFMNRLDNMTDRHSYAVWQVTPVNDPQYVYLPTEPFERSKKGWDMILGGNLNTAYHEFAPGGLKIHRALRLSYKFGAWSPKGEITATKYTTTFHMAMKVYSNAPYIDNMPLQVFTYPNPDKLVELQLMGPFLRMERGEGAVLSTTWRLSESR